jgi:succinate-semialdehyde dehydrogenase/glutarate-semialdehyde dehydrogenase
MSKLTSTNPSKNYQSIGEVEVSTPDDVRAAVAMAHGAKKAWRDLGVAGRVELLRKVSAKFAENKERLSELEAEEMGMPVKEAYEDTDFGLDYLNSYLDKGEDYLKSVVTMETDTEIHEVFKEPYGVAACIVPWNFPFANWVWQCGENLVAGNTIVFKHSEESQLCGKLIDEIVNSVLPEGIFNEVYGDGSVGELLVNQDVNLICFTGSTKTGIKINQVAAGRLIPTAMELGGSAPGIIFEDANVDSVIGTIFTARFMACGQMCDALKRLIVHESQYDKVVAKLTELIKSKRIGEATDKQVDFGPLVAKRQLDLLEEQVADAIAKGANVLIGGKRPDGFEGAYYEPTLLTNIAKDMRVWQEEVFGPVLPIIQFTDESQAIRMANDTKYGLGAYIFTADNERFMRVAKQLESGMVSQNTLSYINVCNPFTGYKMSGGGREHAQFGFEDVTQIKVIARQK